MDPRIRQLLSPQLKQWVGDSNDNFSKELQKFAESIVKECSRVAKLQCADNRVCDAIEFHFGVEQ